MCIIDPPEGERRSKKSTQKHYESQEEKLRREQKGGPWRVDPDNPPYGGKSGWWFSSEGASILTRGRFVRWFRWVFLDLDHHQENCRWRQLINHLRSSSSYV